MEIEALKAILMDDIQELDPSECGLKTNFTCFQITISPKVKNGLLICIAFRFHLRFISEFRLDFICISSRFQRVGFIGFSL